jgi:hypothetical protein
MNIRPANVRGFLGKGLSSPRGRGVNDDLKGSFSGRVDFSGRISMPAVGRRSPTQFSKMEDSHHIDESPPSPTCSSLTSRSIEDTDNCSQNTSSSADPSSPPIAGALSPSRAQESASVLEFMDSLEDIDESYMLSVFWNAGDNDSSRDSVAGLTRCSSASASTASTSTTSYTWTSSSRSRHKGAYKKRSRVVKDAPKGSWIDTMEDSSALHLGFRNSWSATQGWTQAKAPAWDSQPDPSRWDSLNPLFDVGERQERIEI